MALRSPVEFQFIGSNAATCSVESDRWKVLCVESSEKVVERADDVRGCQVEPRKRRESMKAFRCLGVKILRTGATLNGTIDFTQVQRVRMWQLVNAHCY